MHPLKRFAEWYDLAQNTPAIRDASAMTLATASRHGAPSARTVLLKGVDQHGFIFFTNMNSRKARELMENPVAALCFYWDEIGRQVRVEGEAQRTTAAESDAYFATRARESQIGAWASQQSEELDARETLEAAFARYAEQFRDTPAIPRPPHWGGWRVIPMRVEFWEEGAHRLHTRRLYVRESTGWAETLLYP